ncbi:lasso RiPP family leader peptide-containing protein [Streptomyces sp. NPDC059455]
MKKITGAERTEYEPPVFAEVGDFAEFTHGSSVGRFLELIGSYFDWS